MKTTFNKATLNTVENWVEFKSRGRYAAILNYIDFKDGAIDMIFRTHDSKYFLVELLDSAEKDPLFGGATTYVRSGYISKRKYLEYKNTKN